jgi:hypothetical protein
MVIDEPAVTVAFSLMLMLPEAETDPQPPVRVML